MELGLNLEGLEVKEGFEVLPSNTYEFRVEKIEKKVSRAGKDYLNWQLKVINDPDWNNTTVFHITSLSEKALQMPTGIVAMWKALGLPLNEVNTTDAIGLEITLDIGQETFQVTKDDGSKEDRLQNRVERVHFPD